MTSGLIIPLLVWGLNKHMSFLLFLLSFGWMDGCDGWTNVSADGCPSVHPAFDVFYDRWRWVGGWFVGWTVIIMCSNKHTHTHSKSSLTATAHTHRHIPDIPLILRWRGWGGRRKEVFFFFICRWGLKSWCAKLMWGYRNTGTRCAVREEGGEVLGEVWWVVQEGSQSSHHDVATAVQGEVVGPWEGAVTLGAAEGFDPRVLAEVSGQLVGAGKAPGTALPGTVVGLLSWRKQETREGVRKGWEKR